MTRAMSVTIGNSVETIELVSFCIGYLSGKIAHVSHCVACERGTHRA